MHFRRTLVLQGCKGKAEARLERSSDFVSTGDAGIKFRRTADLAAWFGADGRCKKWRVSSSVGGVVESYFCLQRLFEQRTHARLPGVGERRSSDIDF